MVNAFSVAAFGCKDKDMLEKPNQPPIGKYNRKTVARIHAYTRVLVGGELIRSMYWWKLCATKWTEILDLSAADWLIYHSVEPCNEGRYVGSCV